MYHVDQTNGDLIIEGFQNGIGDSPQLGLTDVRNVNVISVPGEASVNFSTSQISSPGVNGSITSVSGQVATYTSSATSAALEGNIAIYFTSAGSFSGFTLATPYYVTAVSGGTFKMYTTYAAAIAGTTLTTFSGSGTAATFVAYQVGIKPSYVTTSTNSKGGILHFANLNPGYGIDSLGMAWSSKSITGTNSYWTYMGNSITDQTGSPGDTGTSNASGNGIAVWSVSNGAATSNFQSADILVVLRNSNVDMMPLAKTGSLSSTFYGTLNTWNYGWDPVVGSFGGVDNAKLTTAKGTNNSHDAIIAPDGRLYFCDAFNIQKLFQTASGTIFDPLTTNSYTYTTFNLLPISETAQTIAPLGVKILIGGSGYNAYNWDTTSNLVTNPIPIAEAFISKIVTINVNAYLFAGNRGRIYITNGAQANLWKKIPDHVSNTIEPKFQWGGATSVKNQLYFSFQLQDNFGTNLTNAGGVWAADLDTRAIRLVNKLSFGTYAGYATALIPQLYTGKNSSVFGGTALNIGWDSGTSSYGIDTPSTNIYTTGESYIISDYIPVGTSIQPITPAQFEYKLASPLLSGEKVQLLVASSLSTGTDPTFTSLGTTSGDGKLVSDIFPNATQNQQWVLVKCVLTGNNSSPSFNRLTQIRVKGASVKQTGLSNLQ